MTGRDESSAGFYGLGGKETHIKTEYNSKGQLYRVSEPYTGSAPPGGPSRISMTITAVNRVRQHHWE